jgi:phytoene synthase
MSAADQLRASYRFCENLARREAKNFYFSFLLLPRPQRNAMCAIYAFMRYCDDLSDAEGIEDRESAIARWQVDLQQALAGKNPDHPLWPAFADSVARYKIPHEYFHQMIEGVRSDLEPRALRTFGELYDYCYHVASVVGLTVIHIFGFEDPQALVLAEKCGVAFQLTNILRDVREDALHGRVYLPAEDLERFHVAAEELKHGPMTPAIQALLEFEGQRARGYYRESAPLVGMIRPASRGSLRALIGIYRRLLDVIEACGYNVLNGRVKVPSWEKIWIAWKSRWV